MSAGPSKTDIEAVFNRLRTQGSNKVLWYNSLSMLLSAKFFIKSMTTCTSFGLKTFISCTLLITLDMFRLQCEESNMVIGDIRRIHLY